MPLNASIGPAEEHQHLRDVVRSFTARHVPPDVVRHAVEATTETLPSFWDRICEQDLCGLHLPESHGGSGFGLVELAVVVEELGRALVPGPFLPTVLAGAVLHRGNHQQYCAGLAQGSTIGAVGLGSGTLLATPTASGGLVVSGESAPVLGGHLAEVFVLPVAEGERTSWVVVPRSSAEVTDLTSHDLTRRLSRVHVDNLTVPAADVLSGIDETVPYDLAATLFAAEASGLADWATSTATEHATVREQFGRPIGRFQGVKHRCSRMLVRSEQARACAWDAARANDGAPGATGQEASLAAAVAGSMSVEAGFATAKECIQTLGGIGFTWEHDAGLYLRRSQTLRILLGPAERWQRRVAQLSVQGTRRQLGVELPQEAEQIRSDVRRELAPAVELSRKQRLDYLAEHGYAAPHLAKPWGKGADPVTQLVIEEEMESSGLQAADMVIGAWVVPTLIEHGSEHQQEKFLPATLRGDLVWCQLFSEPAAGSDLAGLTTRAERVEGGWRVAGQKVWTSMAREAHWGILLARTDPDAAKHKGLSYFLLDMTSPGIEARPLRELTGDALFNEVFLDDVFIPDTMLVGAPGDGWKLARTTLANERVSLSANSSLGNGVEELLRIAGQEPDEMDAARMSTLGSILCDAQSAALLGVRSTLRSLSGHQPGPESSISKLIGVEHVQQVWEVVMDWSGPESLSGPVPASRSDATWMFLNSRCLSIAGGTTDVQLNIIGERLLGLARDPAPDRDAHTKHVAAVAG